MSSEDIGGNMWLLGGACYKTSTIINNVMMHNSDATSTWKSMISNAKSLGHNISRVHNDNDTVFFCKESTMLCESERIAVEKIVPYSHSQLGRIERQWRTLADGAKTLLLVAKLPETFWGHALLAKFYIKTVVDSRDLTGSPWSSSPRKSPT